MLTVYAKIKGNAKILTGIYLGRFWIKANAKGNAKN